MNFPTPNDSTEAGDTKVAAPALDDDVLVVLMVVLVTDTKGHCCTTVAALLQQGGAVDVDGGGGGGGGVDVADDDVGSAAKFGLAPVGVESGLAMLMILVPPAPPTGTVLTNHVAIQLLQVHWV